MGWELEVVYICTFATAALEADPDAPFMDISIDVEGRLLVEVMR